MPLPPGVKTVAEDPKADLLAKELKKWQESLAEAKKADKPDKKAIDKMEKMIAQKLKQIEDKAVEAEKFGYEKREWDFVDAKGTKGTYHRPAIEELIRWRLWDRTGAGLMAELGSHQLDAASIFIKAMYMKAGQTDRMPHPLSVAASGNRPLFPRDRDIEDHVFCIFEFPAPDYDAKDPEKAKKKIGVQYASINGNGFGGYGETVFGTNGTMILETEKEAMLYKVADTKGKTRIVPSKKEGLALEVTESGDEESLAVGQMAMLEAERGYAEELEHWAWCIRNPAPENQPRCHAKVALKDAVIALTSNKAAREGRRIEFKESWFEPESDETPDDLKAT
jgi:predicted dehydrogenase